MEKKKEKDVNDVMEQGSTYQENSENLDEMNSEEETDGGGLFSKDNPAFKYILVGGVIFVLIFIGLAVLFYTKKKEEKEPADFVTEEEEPEFTYSEDETEVLRSYGYTGYEIEENEEKEVPYEDLIKQAEELQEERMENEVKPYFDNASKEFKQLWKNTWVGQPKLEYDDNADNFNYAVETVNVDYEKLPPRGVQLFIKVYLDDGNICFMSVTPERYSTLKEEGNIVLSIEYTTTGDDKIIITNITEIPQE